MKAAQEKVKAEHTASMKKGIKILVVLIGIVSYGYSQNASTMRLTITSGKKVMIKNGVIQSSNINIYPVKNVTIANDTLYNLEGGVPIFWLVYNNDYGKIYLDSNAEYHNLEIIRGKVSMACWKPKCIYGYLLLRFHCKHKYISFSSNLPLNSITSLNSQKCGCRHYVILPKS